MAATIFCVRLKRLAYRSRRDSENQVLWQTLENINVVGVVHKQTLKKSVKTRRVCLPVHSKAAQRRMRCEHISQTKQCASTFRSHDRVGVVLTEDSTVDILSFVACKKQKNHSKIKYMHGYVTPPVATIQVAGGANTHSRCRGQLHNHCHPLDEIEFLKDVDDSKVKRASLVMPINVRSTTNTQSSLATTKQKPVSRRQRIINFNIPHAHVDWHA